MIHGTAFRISLAGCAQIRSPYGNRFYQGLIQMVDFARLLPVTLVLITAAVAPAEDRSLYSLDRLGAHPYRYLPPAGHASQNPGSPKWFVPGYGYRIPGFGPLNDSADIAYGYPRSSLHVDRFGPRSGFELHRYRAGYIGTWGTAGTPWTQQREWPEW